MREGHLWVGEPTLPKFLPNLAQLLNHNANRFGDKPIFQQIQNGNYRQLSWDQFRRDVCSIQQVLSERGLKRGDRVAILSVNRQEMLETELAIMSMGAVAVPIFAGYPADKADELVKFCRPAMIIVADQDQFEKLQETNKFKTIIHFDPISIGATDQAVSFSDMLNVSGQANEISGSDVASDDVCLMMYTSGTMGKPKCVQLTHGNILSQQAAMKDLWNLDHNDRFLSYLPWHHSFGGIYEKYSAIYNGAVLSLESGFGKDIDLLIENWGKVKPTAFFSVPRVYQEITTRILQDKEVEKMIFHDGLRFIFTAAAPLPQNISDMFESRNIPVYEGYGLTETTPCCTVTNPKLKRESGVVGQPIAGVTISLSDDSEILVRGPNVMKGYFDNPEETKKVLPDDGWFYTGDIGRFTETGLKLISRKDRIFKLSNAEKVVPTEIENLIVKDCPYLSHAFVTGSGEDYPVILLFPNQKMFSQLADPGQIKNGCECPGGYNEFSDCLGHCLKKMNESLEAKYSCVQSAMLVDYELSIENEELTPSMKLAPNVVGKVFKANIEFLHGKGAKPEDKVYIINVEQ